MSKELKLYLTTALSKLETEFKKECVEKGYTQEVEQIKILIEMIKEQIGHETTDR
jgi:hypothetical protein